VFFFCCCCGSEEVGESCSGSDDEWLIKIKVGGFEGGCEIRNL